MWRAAPIRLHSLLVKMMCKLAEPHVGVDNFQQELAAVGVPEHSALMKQTNCHRSEQKYSMELVAWRAVNRTE